MNKTNKNKTKKNRVRISPLVVIRHLVLMTFAILCIIPIIAIIAISLSEDQMLVTNGYSLLPQDITLKAYRLIFNDLSQIMNAYGVSIFVTVAGGFLSLMVVSMLAYPISRRDFAFKKPLSFYIFFTMLFNGGLVPWYIVISKYLNLSDTIWVLILPYVAVPWYILLLRTYFSKIPVSLIESAKIDGATEFRTFFAIVLPLSKPALATIGLFIVLQYWNDWWLSLLFIESESLIPLQYLLYRIMNNIQFLRNAVMGGTIRIDTKELPQESTRMAMMIVAAGPMLFVFPFFQKYFVKGLTVGAVKG